MNQLNTKQSIGQMVAERPSRAMVFELLELDYCCGGKKDLETACRDKGLNLSIVVQELQEIDANPTDKREIDWTTAPLHKLIDHIVRVHHGYLSDALPRLTQLIGKVKVAHGDNHAEMSELVSIFADLRRELEKHTREEETVLFPLIEQLESASQSNFSETGTIGAMILSLEHDHDLAGASLAKIRALTHDYTPPSDACNSYRAMLDGLVDLEVNMHQHVHKENNILFPRAIEQESLSTLQK